MVPMITAILGAILGNTLPHAWKPSTINQHITFTNPLFANITWPALPSCPTTFSSDSAVASNPTWSACPACPPCPACPAGPNIYCATNTKASGIANPENHASEETTGTKIHKRSERLVQFPDEDESEGSPPKVRDFFYIVQDSGNGKGIGDSGSREEVEVGGKGDETGDHGNEGELRMGGEEEMWENRESEHNDL